MYLNFIQQCHCIPRCHLCRGECWGLYCRSSKETSLGLRRMRCHCQRGVLICSKIRNGTAVLCKLLKSTRLKNHIRNGNTAKTCISVQMLHHWSRLKSLMSLLKTALILLTAKQRYSIFCIWPQIRGGRCRTTLGLRYGSSKWFLSAAKQHGTRGWV